MADEQKDKRFIKKASQGLIDSIEKGKKRQTELSLDEQLQYYQHLKTDEKKRDEFSKLQTDYYTGIETVVNNLMVEGKDKGGLMGHGKTKEGIPKKYEIKTFDDAHKVASAIARNVMERKLGQDLSKMSDDDVLELLEPYIRLVSEGKAGAYDFVKDLHDNKKNIKMSSLYRGVRDQLSQALSMDSITKWQQKLVYHPDAGKHFSKLHGKIAKYHGKKLKGNLQDKDHFQGIDDHIMGVYGGQEQQEKNKRWYEKKDK